MRLGVRTAGTGFIGIELAKAYALAAAPLLQSNAQINTRVRTLDGAASAAHGINRSTAVPHPTAQRVLSTHLRSADLQRYICLSLFENRYGAKHIATATTGEGFAFVRSLGATFVTDYTKEDIFDVLPDDSVDIVCVTLALPQCRAR